MNSKYIAPNGAPFQDPTVAPAPATAADAAIPPPPVTVDVPLPGGQIGAVPVTEIEQRLARGAELEAQASQLAFLQAKADRANTNPAYAAALNLIDQRDAQGLPPIPTQTPDASDATWEPVGAPANPAMNPEAVRLQALEGQIAQLSQAREADTMRREIESAVAAHPSLQGSDVAMQVARANAAASMAVTPGITPANAVAAAAKQVDALIGGQRELEARRQDMAEAPGAPTTSASLTPNPQSSDDLPPAEVMGKNAYKSLKDGSFREAALKYIERAEQKGAAGNTPSQ